MALAEYRRKRHFNTTPEPSGDATGRTKKQAAKKRPGGALSFVVQKHDATRLHYDFRLELDGVLKSWAVPKGPSYDPEDKRLAVEVEDHPLDYASFEGTIPEGEYGAGEVIVWDRGTWTPDGDPHKGLARGKLELHLDGEKLRGGWVLLRIRNRSDTRRDTKNNWLLVKRRDDHARSASEYDVTEARPESVKSKRLLGERVAKTSRGKSAKKKPQAKVTAGRATVAKAASRKKGRAKKGGKKGARSSRGKSASGPLAPEQIPGAQKKAMPGEVALQLATLESTTPSGSEWLHEMKFDGYRMLCRLEKGKARLVTRQQQDWTHRYPQVAEAAADLQVDSALLDGEVVALLPSGISSFQALQNAAKNGAQTQLAYYAFDLLYLDGYDLRAAPLIERKAALERLLQGTEGTRIRLSEHFDDDGPTFFRQCCQMGLEGVISKRRDRPYRSGRSDEWIKTKCVAREELVIGGFTLSTAMKRGIGALLVGYYENKQLIYAGRVGTGFTTQMLEDLRQQLEKLKQDTSPFAAVPAKERSRDVRWVRPHLVAQVEFTGWTEGNILRHPSFQGLREDKPAASVTRPGSLSPALTPGNADNRKSNSSKESISRGATNGKPQKAAGKKSGKKSGKKPQPVSIENVSVSLTHPERVLYPDSGLTKIGLATYYTQIANWILPHLKDRPLSLVRCPGGQGTKCFFQKHATDSTPDSLERVNISEKEGNEEYVMVQNLDGLLALVQMSVLEIHPWGSRSDRLEQPDRLIFDLDPGEGVAWPRVVEAAFTVREILRERGLESFVKTTGGKGLHVVAPLSPRRTEWDAAKEFCQSIAEKMAEDDPRRYLAHMSKAARKGKIFVDYLRNGRGATAIVAYSTRARPGAPVSTPLAWDELSPAIKSDHFNASNLPGRLDSLKRDPWEGISELKQTIK